MGLYNSKDKIYQNQNKKGLNSCMRYAAEKKKKSLVYFSTNSNTTKGCLHPLKLHDIEKYNLHI